MTKPIALTTSLFVCPTNVHVRVHSKQLDDLFGIQIKECESLIKKDDTDFNSWIGLEPEILQTPYSETFEYFNVLKDKSIKKIIDFGAAYGRVGIVCSSIFKNSIFIGYEIIKQRAEEGTRVLNELKLKDSHINCENILAEEFMIEDADIYFIYDFSDPAQQRMILDKLSKKVFANEFFIIARGKGIRSLIQNKYPEFHSLYKPLHFEKASIYSSYTNLT